MSREIGSLRALSNGESQYVGSSSGVYFINNVRRVFSAATAATIESTKQAARNGQSSINLSPEDCLVGGEDQIDNRDGSSQGLDGQPCPGRGQHPGTPWDITIIETLHKLPEYLVARQLVMTYFRIWHPLVPFLHGPECLKALDALYSGSEESRKTPSLSQAVIFRCIFNIASLDRPGSPASGIPDRCLPSQLLPALGLVSLKCDIASIQALLCAQVYFVATMSLRNASTVGGLVSKSIFQSGLHRCPHRYGHLLPDDRSMRKRVFWSAYVLDRFLSQSLGHPNGIQDSDIDVCLPGHRDLHEPVTASALTPPVPPDANAILHLPVNHPDRRAADASPRQEGSRDSSPGPDGTGTGDSINPEAVPNVSSSEARAVTKHRQLVQAVLASHVKYSQLIGRILEIFHKSIHVREADNRAVLFLKADIGAWGNILIQVPSASMSTSQANPHVSSLGPDPTVFPYISYQYSLLLVNRPALSLDSASAEFRAAIQACIAAGNNIIRTLESNSERGYPLFWPGYMSAVWMSGLVFAFASQLRMHSSDNAIVVIKSSLDLLTTMGQRWQMAMHCRSVLETLLEDIKVKASPKRSRRWTRHDPSTSRPSPQGTAATSRAPKVPGPSNHGSSKRRALGSRDGAQTQSTRASPPHHADPLLPEISSIPDEVSMPPDSMSADIFHTNYTPEAMQESGYHEGWRAGVAMSEPMGFHPSVLRSCETMYSGRPDNTFGVVPDDLSTQPMRHSTQRQSLIPTTFPDRQIGQQYPHPVTADYSVFDVFDGATWGSLLDLVDDQNGG